MTLTGIYQIQSKVHPERIYIGSAVDIDDRWRCHLKKLRKNKHHSNKLQHHFNKYGITDLVFSIIALCSKEELRPVNGIIWIEQFFILAYKFKGTNRPYFNMVDFAGSSLGYKFTDKQRKRTSDGHRGISQSEETKKKKSDLFKGRLPWNTGKSGYQTKKAIPILQYDKQGNFIKEWRSIIEAEESFGKDSANVSRCLGKRRPSAYGFVWEYKKDILKVA